MAIHLSLSSRTSLGSPVQERTAIYVERRWRVMQSIESSSLLHPDQLLISHWTNRESGGLRVSSEGNDTHHCVGISLAGTSLDFTHAGRRLVSGRVEAGTVQVSAPATSVVAEFHACADIVHLFVPQAVLRECVEDLFRRPATQDIVLNLPELILDPTLARLGKVLSAEQSSDQMLGKIFVESVSLAVISRLVYRQHMGYIRTARKVGPLVQWRLKRLIDYIDANLSDSISLADMAATCGLTRMHFAAQFRAATGRTPHDYLLHRRIEYAKELLRISRSPIIQVALACGFRSQAHFSTVFKRFVGHSPLSWRSMVNPVSGASVTS